MLADVLTALLKSLAVAAAASAYRVTLSETLSAGKILIKKTGEQNTAGLRFRNDIEWRNSSSHNGVTAQTQKKRAHLYPPCAPDFQKPTK